MGLISRVSSRTYRVRKKIMKFSNKSRKLEKSLKILNLPKNYTKQQLKESYHQLSRIHHPDKNLHQSSKNKDKAAKKMIQIIDAYKFLSDRLVDYQRKSTEINKEEVSSWKELRSDLLSMLFDDDFWRDNIDAQLLELDPDNYDYYKMQTDQVKLDRLETLRREIRDKNFITVIGTLILTVFGFTKAGLFRQMIREALSG